MSVTAIILAAGEGTRMKSNHAKVSHKILGKPMINWVVDAALAGGCDEVVVVVGSHAEEVIQLVSGTDHVRCVNQAERLGTGHAVKIALEAADINAGPVVVLNGDLPLIEASTISKFAASVTNGYAAAVLTMTPPNVDGYGRIEFNARGDVARIIEQKDCTDRQAQMLRDCNAGCYAFDGEQLSAHINELSCKNAQNEYYLTDMIEIMRNAGERVTAFRCEDYQEGLGVNSRVQLAQLSAIARDKVNERHMASGVTMIDPTSVYIGPEVTINRDTIILPQTMLWGKTSIGEGCIVGPNTRLTDTHVGSFSVLDETVAIEATIDNNVSCGPRAYLRPNTHLCDGSKAGTHVEIKNSTIGEGSKVPHLSYIGDTQMGCGVNVGAGSITCNYDGINKHSTTIGDHTFIGSDTMMVAPVTIGQNAVTGAGGTITSDVPDGALALERCQQINIEGYTQKKASKH